MWHGMPQMLPRTPSGGISETVVRCITRKMPPSDRWRISILAPNSSSHLTSCAHNMQNSFAVHSCHRTEVYRSELKDMKCRVGSTTRDPCSYRLDVEWQLYISTTVSSIGGLYDFDCYCQLQVWSDEAFQFQMQHPGQIQRNDETGYHRLWFIQCNGWTSLMIQKCIICSCKIYQILSGLSWYLTKKSLYNANLKCGICIAK